MLWYRLFTYAIQKVIMWLSTYIFTNFNLFINRFALFVHHSLIFYCSFFLIKYYRATFTASALTRLPFMVTLNQSLGLWNLSIIFDWLTYSRTSGSLGDGNVLLPCLGNELFVCYFHGNVNNWKPTNGNMEECMRRQE